MEIETRKEGDIIIVKPLGKNIDSSNCTDFKGKVVDLINQGNKFFVLNLAAIDFIDSRGLGTVISILKNLASVKGILVLCELKPQIINLLNLTNMHKVFHIDKNESDAIQTLQHLKL